MTSQFNVKTEAFEGPLDLLLSLIEKRKLFINDISLAKVADDYILYIQKSNELPMGETAHFILVASTLLLIKSKSLLPTLALTEEEEESVHDLELRLKLYKRFKELSQHTSERFGGRIIFAKLSSKNISPVFSPGDEITVIATLQSIKELLKNLPKEEKLPRAMVQKIVSLEEMIDRLTVRVTETLKINFSEFAKEQEGKVNTGSKHIVTREERAHVIVSFLAMLELVKQGIIHATQSSESEDITLETQNLGIPSYK
jgi:segregation and condensation protein A